MNDKKIVRITKGKDPYLKVTPLAGYCLEKGWKIVRECVDIVLPKNGELRQFQAHVRDGKIVVLLESNKENEL